MNPDIQRRIQSNHDALMTLYRDNQDHVLGLQATLLQRVLPDVVDELELDLDDAEGAREWVEDTDSLFRLLKRHRFTTTFALEAAREILVWRLEAMHHHMRYHKWNGNNSRLLLCIPPPAHDILGRPILVLRVSELKECSEYLKDCLVDFIENLRIHLKYLNAEARDRDPDVPPILQYVLLLDMQDASISDISADLPSWYLREVVPRFPGLLAGVFIVNYSWTHSGIWGVMRHILPDSALSKVFFPSQSALHHVMPPSSLPEDYGGSLPPLEDIPSLYPSRPPSLPSIEFISHAIQETPSRPSPDTNGHAAVPWKVSAISDSNPFYGYPVDFSSAKNTPARTAQLHYGRRRKRDLLRTLALLWWKKWKGRISVAFLLLLTLFLVRVGIRRRHLLWPFMKRLRGG